MAPSDFEVLEPWFERIEIKTRTVLLRRNDIIDYIYFPETGQASVLVAAHEAGPIEVGTIGFEGMTDFAFSGRATGETLYQVGGEAIRIRRTPFVERVQQSLPLALLVLKWHQALMSQMAFTALSHGAFKIPERLARFILMLDDRAEGRDLPLGHEFFAWMLSVRRAGVTENLRDMVAQGAIETGRSRIRVLDRNLLTELAHGSYGPAEAEYKRVFAA